MISILRKPESIASKLAGLLLSREVFKELGEPILFDEGDAFFVKEASGRVVGFSAISKDGFLKYMYVVSDCRKMGLFSEMYEAVETAAQAFGFSAIRAVSTGMALPIYQKKGFEITHSYTNYFKIKKDISNANFHI